MASKMNARQYFRLAKGVSRESHPEVIEPMLEWLERPAWGSRSHTPSNYFTAKNADGQYESFLELIQCALNRGMPEAAAWAAGFLADGLHELGFVRRKICERFVREPQRLMQMLISNLELPPKWQHASNISLAQGMCFWEAAGDAHVLNLHDYRWRFDPRAPSGEAEIWKAVVREVLPKIDVRAASMERGPFSSMIAPSLFYSDSLQDLVDAAREGSLLDFRLIESEATNLRLESDTHRLNIRIEAAEIEFSLTRKRGIGPWFLRTSGDQRPVSSSSAHSRPTLHSGINSEPSIENSQIVDSPQARFNVVQLYWADYLREHGGLSEFARAALIPEDGHIRVIGPDGIQMSP